MFQVYLRRVCWRVKEVLEWFTVDIRRYAVDNSGDVHSHRICLLGSSIDPSCSGHSVRILVRVSSMAEIIPTLMRGNERERGRKEM